MKPTIIEDQIFEFEPFEEDGSVLMAAETPWRGMADELQELHYLKGAQFINQLKLIIYYGEVISSFLLSEPSLLVFSIIKYFVKDMKNKCHPKVTFKWSSVDQGLLPALSGVANTYV